MKTQIGKVKLPQPKEKAIMPFGKFEGENVEDIPIEYLQWLVNQPSFRDQHKRLSREIDDVLEDSQERNAYFERNYDEDGF